MALLTGFWCILGSEARRRGIPQQYPELVLGESALCEVAAEIGREYRGKGSNLILGPSVQAPSHRSVCPITWPVTSMPTDCVVLVR